MEVLFVAWVVPRCRHPTFTSPRGRGRRYFTGPNIYSRQNRGTLLLELDTDFVLHQTQHAVIEFTGKPGLRVVCIGALDSVP